MPFLEAEVRAYGDAVFTDEVVRLTVDLSLWLELPVGLASAHIWDPTGTKGHLSRQPQGAHMYRYGRVARKRIILWRDSSRLLSRCSRWQLLCRGRVGWPALQVRRRPVPPSFGMRSGSARCRWGRFGSAPHDHGVAFVRDRGDCDSCDWHVREPTSRMRHARPSGQGAHMCCGLWG